MVAAGARWDCTRCGHRHTGHGRDEEPTHCERCGHDALEWWFNYGYRGRFA